MGSHESFYFMFFKNIFLLFPSLYLLFIGLGLFSSCSLFVFFFSSRSDLGVLERAEKGDRLGIFMVRRVWGKSEVSTHDSNF